MPDYTAFKTPIIALALTAALLPLASAPAAAQALRELTTDRPDQTESPITVDKGHFQVEMDFITATRDRSREAGRDVRTTSYGVMPINFKYGLTDTADIQFVFDSYQHSQTKDLATGRVLDKTSGVGDLTIRYKYNFFGDDGGNALGVMPFVKIPTNSNGIGNKYIEGGVILPYAIELGEGVGLGLMTEVDLLRNSGDTAYNPTFINSATVGFDVTSRVGAYVELFTAKSTEPGALWEVQADAGMSYALSPTAALDFGVNVGVTKAAPDIGPFVGLSIKF